MQLRLTEARSGARGFDLQHVKIKQGNKYPARIIRDPLRQVCDTAALRRRTVRCGARLCA